MEIECNSCGAIMVIPKRKPTGKAADLLKIAEEAKFNATGDAEYAFRALEMGLRELEDDSARLDWLVRVFQFPYSPAPESWKRDVTNQMVFAADSGWKISGDEAVRLVRAAIDAAREGEGLGDD